MSLDEPGAIPSYGITECLQVKYVGDAIAEGIDVRAVARQVVEHSLGTTECLSGSCEVHRAIVQSCWACVAPDLARTVTVMPGRVARSWRPRRPRRSLHERLVDLYADAHTKLATAFKQCPSRDAKGDSEEVHLFLVKLTQANLRLRLLRALCRDDVKDLVDEAIEEVDKAVRAPATKTVYGDPSAWLMCSIQAVDEAARRNVQVIL